ncbi:MAG: phosphonate C-P lyase system protein PhnG [Pseudomonadota bacterium]
MSHDEDQIALRQRWISILAKADSNKLLDLWSKKPETDAFQVLRKPETGLVMVRGRMGGTGAPFNAGEATVTRCSVRSTAGHVGHSYVMGRNHDHAMIAAKIDAQLQDETRFETVMSEIVEPLAEYQSEAKQINREKVAATKVDFFTMVRGED